MGPAHANTLTQVVVLQVKLDAAQLFSTHVEVLSSDGNVVRISLGNIFRSDSSKASADVPQQWRWLHIHHSGCIPSLHHPLGNHLCSQSACDALHNHWCCHQSCTYVCITTS